MSSSAEIRRRLVDLTVKRAAVEKASSDAESRRATKDAEAASNRDRAPRASSPSTQKMYLRQAESAQKASLAEGKKVADLSKKRAALAKEEGTLHRSVTEALKREAAADATKAAKDKRDREAVALKDKREREAQERKQVEQRRADDRRRQQERLEDEYRRQQETLRRDQERRDGQSRTDRMIGATEQRLTEQIAAIRPPKKEQLRILYATAASHGDLRVDEEIRRVKAAVNAAQHRDQVLIEHLSAATAGDLLNGLSQFKPHVVHFSGHADQNVLVFDTGSDTHGPGHSVTAKAFKSAVEAPDESPMLVVLNACESAAQLQALLGKVPLGVSMTDSVDDLDAMTFATRFYRSIAEGQSVTAALALARADMEMNGLPDHDLPVLATADGVDPSDIRLVIAPA